jgi:hypothetical protein
MGSSCHSPKVLENEWSWHGGQRGSSLGWSAAVQSVVGDPGCCRVLHGGPPCPEPNCPRATRPLTNAHDSQCVGHLHLVACAGHVAADCCLLAQQRQRLLHPAGVPQCSGGLQWCSTHEVDPRHQCVHQAVVAAPSVSVRLRAVVAPSPWCPPWIPGLPPTKCHQMTPRSKASARTHAART